MIERNLTGRIRYRIEHRLFRESLMVLQVEVHAKGYTIEYPGAPADVDDKYWRDARVTDFVGHSTLGEFRFKEAGG